MKINKNKFKSIIASIFLLVLVIGAAYAYLGTFNVDLSNDIAVNINSTSPGNTAFVANATQLNLQVPASSMGSYLANNTVAAMENNAVLNVSLQGANGFKTTCTYDIVYEYDSSSLVYGSSNAPATSGATKEITLQIENVTGTNYYETERNFNYYTGSYNDNANDKWTSTTKRTLVSGATIESTGTSTSQNINVIGRYYNLDAYQDLGGKAFNGTIYVENVNCNVEKYKVIPSEYGYMTILKNNGGQAAIEAKGTPDFSQIADTNEGMYAARDDLGMSYYFRGAIENNWVKFGKYSKDTYVYSSVYDEESGDTENVLTDECDDTKTDCTLLASGGDDMYWRIVRVNGDNSIRMIYSGITPPDENTKVAILYNNIIGRHQFNENNSKAEYVGYMYTLGEQHGTTQSSKIKIYIDDWFANYTNLVSNKSIVDEIFCNDRSFISGFTWPISKPQTYYFAGYERIKNKNPSYQCLVANDKFTVSASIGNAALTYPIGLATADELSMAGIIDDTRNESNFLTTVEEPFLLTPKSANLNDSFNEIYISYNNSDYIIYNMDVYRAGGVQPVINLSSDVVLTGDGTWNNPYEVVS